MDRDSIEYIQYIDELIEKKLEKKIKNLKYMQSYPAIVTSVGTGVASVMLATDIAGDAMGNAKVINNLKNKTGVTLAVGDPVYLVSPTNNLTNVWIDKKF